MVVIIQHMLDTDKEVRERLSPWVIGCFSDLALLSEVMHQLFIFYPWSVGWRDIGYDKEQLDTEIDIYWRTFTRAINNHIFKYCGGYDSKDPLAFLHLAKGNFRYPSDKRRTKQTTNEMVEAETQLDAFWAGLDEFYKSLGYNSLWDMLQLFVAEERTLRRTKPWVDDEVDLSSAEPSKRPDDSGDGSAASASLYRQEAVETNNCKTQLQSMTRTKIKTRGDSKEEESRPTPEDTALPRSHLLAQPVPISKRAYKTFCTLFHMPSTESEVTPLELGDLSWADFKYAMTTIGFAVESLYGSVYISKPVAESRANIGLDTP